MLTSDFDFELPPELIAQHPAPARDQSRLLVLDRQDGCVSHHQFADLSQWLRPGDLLVLNNSRVIPARLRGVNALSGGAFEVLLLEENRVNDWWVMVRPGKRARVGTHIKICDLQGNVTPIMATVREVNGEGHRRLEFAGTPNLLDELERVGEIPLPPYIERTQQDPGDRERYQTVYAQPPGSVAAPTAGLHFTPALLDNLQQRGVRTAFVTLHVGLGTFAPVKTDTIGEHPMHEERYSLSPETALALNETRQAGGRVIAVGTTSVRVLETIAREQATPFQPVSGRTRIFIYPPYSFRAVDALITNFHLPKSTLLMLVSAFASPGETRGREWALAAYADAVRERYRFFSYGDAMFIH